MVDLANVLLSIPYRWESVTSPFGRLTEAPKAAEVEVGNQSPLPLVDLATAAAIEGLRWESVTSPFGRLIV